MGFLSLRRAQPSESCSDIGSGKKTATLNTEEDISMLNGQCSSKLYTTNLPAISEMPETRQMVVRATLKQLFTKRYFDICAVREIVEITNGRKDSQAYKLLSALHCIDYKDMEQELRDRIPMLLNECLRDQQDTKEIIDVVLKGVKI